MTTTLTARTTRSVYAIVGVPALIAVAYVVTGSAGLLLDPVAGFAAYVWPPTGIALGATFLIGSRAAPAIFLGALIVNLIAGAPPLVAAMIAAGNLLEALGGAWMLRRLGLRRSLERFHDAYALLIVGAAAAAISATIGVLTLTVAGTVSPSQFWFAWEAWWIGDAIGALLVTPLVLLWISERWSVSGRRSVEFVGILALVLAVAVAVFFSRQTDPTSLVRLYTVFPVLLLMTVRFQQRGATLAVFLLAAVAIAGTARLSGPFASPALGTSLLGLQMFMGIVAGTFLLLGAAMAERADARSAERHARADAESANRVKSEFLATMSHELRTPLNAIVGYAELLQMGVHGELTQTQSEAIDRIRKGERRLRGLIDDVLTFARIESDRVQMDLASVNVLESIHEVEQIVAPQLQAKKLSFHCECASTVNAHADRDKLQQILLNLVVNASKFTPEGGRITVSVRLNGNVVEVQVADTGIGVAPDMLEKVFEPFVQAGRSLASPREGSGLGLAISRNYARLMQGDLSVTSEVGKGSTFTLTLPQSV